MSEKAVQRVEVSVGDIHGSQLVVGDHNTIQTPEGTEVTVLQVGARPVPRLRPLPVSLRPAATEIFGREDELALIASAGAAAPVQLYGGDGSGKTCLLKLAAQRAPAAAEGVVFEPVRHRSADEIQTALYRAFWECEIPFVPAPAQMPDFLADREALLILDDCGLDRGEVETLLDSLPGCAVVLASEERTLWSRGAARRLGGLDPVAAVAVLERELGRSFDPAERTAAEGVVARLGGSPQALVETAALVEDGRTSLRELGEQPGALERRFEPSQLTESQQRIVAVLSALDGAALGTEHVSALAGAPNPEEQLQELERRGWAKSASPRYRSLRRAPSGRIASAQEIAKPLLGQLTAWSRRAGPRELSEEAEAIERALELGAAAERWEETLALSLAAERALAVAAAWTSCRRVLRMGLRAAILIADESARAFLLHQLGSQALCLGDSAAAEAQLGEALQIREGSDEHEGAELTRHNLSQLGGGGGGQNGDGGGSGGPRGPRIAIALAAVAVVAGVLIALAVGGGSGENIANTGPTGHTRSTSTSTTTTTTSTESSTTPDQPPMPPAGDPPAIAIANPTQGATFPAGEEVTASFACTEAEGTRLEACDGSVEGERIKSGDALPLHPGQYALTVIAIDDDGQKSRESVSYEIASSRRPKTDETPPEVHVISPAGAYKQGTVAVVDYSCTDTESEPVTCVSEPADGSPVDTETPGTHSVTITATDAAGNTVQEVVSYQVIAAPPPTTPEPKTTTPEPTTEPEPAVE